jgi:hypothetical protein
MLKRLLTQEWEALAGIVAAVAAIVLHFLHYTEIDTLLAITLVLIALLFLRDLRHESQMDRISSAAEKANTLLGDLKAYIKPSDVVLIGPTELRSASEQFARKGQGEVVWYNVCLRMYKAQEPFDVMLKPFIENPNVTTVRLVLGISEKQRWQNDVLPKIKACNGYKKVGEPHWAVLEERLSFVITETSEGKAEALVSFWGEPFMAVSTDKSVPRYILHVRESSDLIARLKEVERISRVK